MARPFLIAAINVWGLKNAARSLENAAEIQGRSLENAAYILTHRQVYSAGGTTMVGLRAGAALAPYSSPSYITRR